MKKSCIKIVLFLVFAIFLFSTRSKAMLIVLDSGHGGTDPGAINGSILERDITLKTTQYLRDYLSEYDVDVALTHEGFWGYEFSVYDRAMVARNKNADLLVSLHFNSGSGATGSEVWVSANKSLYKYNAATTELGNRILSNLQGLGLVNRGVKTKLVSDSTDVYTDGTRADYYGIIRYAMRGTMIDYGVRTPVGAVDANVQNGEGVPAILVEHCFIQADAEYVNSDDDLRRLAEADGKAIVAQYGLRKKNEKVQSVSIDAQEIELLPGKTKKLSATVLPETAINKNVTWESSDTSVATVDINGNITAKNSGVTTITVKTVDGGMTAKCIVYVQGISISETSIKMFDFDKRQIIANLAHENPSYKLVWSSDNEEVATVDENGLISGVAEGSATITVRIEGTDVAKNILVEISSLGEDKYININNLKEENGILTNIKLGSSKEEFLTDYDISDKLEINISSSDECIGTNTKVSIIDEDTGLTVKEYTCIVYGDISGDGKIDSYDMYLLRADMIDMQKLEGYAFKAANISKNDNVLDSYDMYLLRAHMIDLITISQE